jgi:hypothetical protein
MYVCTEINISTSSSKSESNGEIDDENNEGFNDETFYGRNAANEHEMKDHEKNKTPLQNIRDSDNEETNSLEINSKGAYKLTSSTKKNRSVSISLVRQSSADQLESPTMRSINQSRKKSGQEKKVKASLGDVEDICQKNNDSPTSFHDDCGNFNKNNRSSQKERDIFYMGDIYNGYSSGKIMLIYVQHKFYVCVSEKTHIYRCIHIKINFGKHIYVHNMYLYVYI